MCFGLMNEEAMKNLSNNKGEDEIPVSEYEAGQMIKDSTIKKEN